MSAPEPKPFLYYELSPPPELAAHVMSFWGFEVRLLAGATHLHHVWPDGCVSFSVRIGEGTPAGLGVVGPTTEARRLVVEGGFTYRGMRLRPEAGKAILGFSPSHLRNLTLPAFSILGVPESAALAEAVAAADARSFPDVFHWWIRPRIATPPDPAVRAGAQLAIESHGQASVAAMAAAAALGIRQFQRRFTDATGISPKAYARIRRVRSTLAAVLRGERSWAALAHDLGFADQAHMTRELGDVTGFTPTLLEGRLDAIEHQDVTP